MQQAGIADQHRQPEPTRQHSADRHDREQASLHGDKSLSAERVAGRRVVNEQARQVQQSGKPGHDKNDVQALKPEVVCCHRDMMPKAVNLVT
jgi:hypothetical protein